MGQQHSTTGDTTPWLTVVMPLHNGARFLEETMCSLVACNTEGIEVIAIDSSDDSS